jgi:hypothetical protein
VGGNDEGRDGVTLTNLDQPLFDDADAAKRDLIDYLGAVHEGIIAELSDRPLSVMRVRPGQAPFMQKNVPKYTRRECGRWHCDFQTTPQFLPLHRRQRDDTLELIELAERNGNTRLLANHRQVAANLKHVIAALEAIENKVDSHASRHIRPLPGHSANKESSSRMCHPRPETDLSRTS